MSHRTSLLEGDLEKALEAHERSGVRRDSAALAAFLHGFHMQARRRRMHARRDASPSRWPRDAARHAMTADVRRFEAYRDGLRNGRTDRLLGQRSRYAEQSPNTPYADGYRRGVLGLDEPAGRSS